MQDPPKVTRRSLLGGSLALAGAAAAGCAIPVGLGSLQQEAKEEVLTFDRPPYVLDYHNPLQTDLLRNGVRYRTIYVP
ncbi:hypothetical protein ACTWPT_54220, partial [Nonomuraea sp. 3N208]|uniref:hypothetical protein n=1 Tax=Nonomuraea sp. 3N208 TaxID=3457421 RepID=UPI003FD1EACF